MFKYGYVLQLLIFFDDDFNRYFKRVFTFVYVLHQYCVYYDVSIILNVFLPLFVQFITDICVVFSAIDGKHLRVRTSDNSYVNRRLAKPTMVLQ